MKKRLSAWLRFFRIVNLPTVPGDILVGAAPCAAELLRPGSAFAALHEFPCVWWAIGASSLIYLFGLAQNDILGAAADKDRPIPNGDISPLAARIAAALCLIGALLLGWFGNLPLAWYRTAALLVCCVVIYNYTKRPLVMGLCRGLNVACGTSLFVSHPALGGTSGLPLLCGYSVAAVLGLYIALVTRYSIGEELDPARKRRVGQLIGALIYLQLTGLMIFRVDAYLILGALLLILLRLSRRMFPTVSAS